MAASEPSPDARGGPERRARKSLLTPGQRRALLAVLAASVVLLADSAYLFVTTPPLGDAPPAPGLFEASPWGRAGLGDIAGPTLTPAERDVPGFYQAMLLLHFFGGGALAALLAGFVIWHLRNALRRRNARAVWSGALAVAAAVGLTVTGLFVLSEASSVANRWIFRSHQLLALAVCGLYAAHRIVSIVPPTRRAVRLGLGGLGVTLAALFGIDALTGALHTPSADLASPPAASLPTRPSAPPGAVDPFIPFAPTHLAPAEARFSPSPVTTRTGGLIDRLTLTQDDLAAPAVMAADLKRYGFLVNGAMGSATCERCHAATVAQWSASAHRFSSFNNPFYKASVEALRTEPDGKRRSQWCGACHDPNLLFTGKMQGEIAPDVPEAQAGLTCLACHAIDRLHGKVGNGNYVLTDDAPDPYLFAAAKVGPGRALHDMLVRSKPTVHKRQMLKPFYRQPEFCMTCHKVSLDKPINDYRWLRGQNEYDNWHDSGVARNAARTFYLPPARRVCQDCHMPYEPAVEGDVSARNGVVRSHRFLAVNTALPTLRGDADTIARTEAFLRAEKLRVDVFAVRPLSPAPEAAGPDAAPTPEAPIGPLDRVAAKVAGGRLVELDVVVRNLGVGHTFPGGTNDSNEGWLELTVTDASGKTLAESGRLDARRHLDPEAHQYKVLFVDAQGRPALKRDPQNFHALVYAHTIGPGTADVARYVLRLPDAPTTLTIRARLLWRKFSQGYTEFVFAAGKNGPMPELPITEIAASEAKMGVVAPGEAGTLAGAAPPADASTEADWMRYNDYGIGSLLQADNRTANWAFERVRALAPGRIDGHRNLARVAALEGRLEAAVALLGDCERMEPGDARTAWLWGMARTKEGKYAEAAAAYRRVLAYFPEDRSSLRELARVSHLSGQYAEALDTALAALAIDPEDRMAHYYRMLAYRALGREAEAAEAEKAYTYYKLDESQPEATEGYRQTAPLDNRESLPIHLHPLGAAL